MKNAVAASAADLRTGDRVLITMGAGATENGAYAVRVTAKGFAVFQRQNLDVTQPVVLDVQLTIESAAQVVNVGDEGGKVAVNTDPSSNGGALALGQRELAALSDDPGELAQ
ncbi:MAG TPA: hypothetical protein VEV85_06475 [Bryobacteraceae bacterium]|nr:hypothetical protein [Bryobacteraceae bacterium]